MAKVSGSYLVAKALENEGVDTVFYLMGGPISPTSPRRRSWV